MLENTLLLAAVTCLQTRLEAMERVVALAQEPAAADNTAVLVQAVAHLPGWDEKNFQAGYTTHVVLARKGREVADADAV